MNKLITSFAVLSYTLLSACGEGECIDLVPDPAFDSWITKHWTRPT